MREPGAASAALRAQLAGALAGARSRALRLTVSRTARQVLSRNLTYLSPRKLANIEWALAQIRRDEVRGDFVETGVALGGGAIVIAEHLDDFRAFHGYDVFGMIPPPGDSDPPEVHERYRSIAAGDSKGLAGDTYYGYQDDLYDRVAASFQAFGMPVDGRQVCLHRGLFADTLHPVRPIAFAHIDCDWYEPVKLSLQRIFPYLSPGGYLISDDYYDYAGAAQAVDEFRREHADELQSIRDRGSEHMILRRRSTGS
jgi:O-methyltransferase